MAGKEKVKFGIFILQENMAWNELRDKVVMADRLGFHSFWFGDHLWAPVNHQTPFFEGWTLVSALAACTEGIRLGLMVTCNSLRHPALLAKMASSLDVISNGRVALAIGSGSLEEEHRVFGIPFPKLSERSRKLEEAVQIIKLMFTEEEVNFSGKFYQIKSGAMMPKPVQRPHPPIIIGGGNERFTLPVVARWADSWNCGSSSLKVLEHKLQVLKEECRRAGRDPATLRVNAGVPLVLAPTPRHLDAAMDKARREYGRRIDTVGIIGTPDAVCRRIEEEVSRGVSLFVFTFADGATPQSLELFAREVAPAFS